MREIKFRVYDKEKKLMLHTGDEVDMYDGHDELHSEDEWYPCKDIQIPLSMFSGFQKDFKNRIILMQFTGLTDKNGKEIYEGDIVKTYDWIKPILFADGCFGIADLTPFCLGEAMHFEVLGNIYENPELLEK